MPYKGGVQLLPETQRRPTLASYTSGNRFFWSGVVLGLGVIVAGAVFGGYAANLNEKIAALDGQLQATENGRNKEQEKVLVDAQKQSRILSQLLGSKLYWSQALVAMEKMMQASVKLTRLEASATKGTIGFQGVADSYTAVARQLKAFAEGTGITDVQARSVKATATGTIEFSGELKIDSAKLLNKK